MIDVNFAIDNHFKNIGATRGHYPSATKYEYNLGYSDVVQALSEAHHDLSYALKKEVGRDRVVMNERALETEIKDIIISLLSEVSQVMADMVAQDAQNAVEDALALAYSIDGTARPQRTHKQSQSFASRLGRSMGKAIAKATTDIMTSVSGTKEKKKRKKY